LKVTGKILPGQSGVKAIESNPFGKKHPPKECGSNPPPPKPIPTKEKGSREKKKTCRTHPFFGHTNPGFAGGLLTRGTTAARETKATPKGKALE